MLVQLLKELKYMQYGMNNDMKQIIYNGDKAYQLVRTLKENSLKNPDISVLKQLFHCDTLLRKQGLLYFCRLIEEAEIITN